MIAIGAAFLASHLLAIDNQTRAARAGHDFMVKNG